MGEQSGFTCDGGCGATAVCEPHRQPPGWLTCYGSPHQSLHACSDSCMVAALAARIPPHALRKGPSQ